MGLTQKLGTIPLAVFTDSSNNVGIGGAANASFKLQVTGSVNLEGNVTTTGAQFVQNGFYLTNTNAGTTAGYTNLWGATDGIFFGLRNGTGGGKFIFQSATSYDYTFPAATGTLALTSNLSAYLPLTGGTLTGALSGTSASFSSSLTANTFIEIVGDLRFNSTSADRSIYFRGSAGAVDANWKMGNYLTPAGATVVTAAATVIDVFNGAGYGFMVRNTSNAALLQIAGNTGAATFSSSVTAGGSSLFNANTGGLSANILTIKGGGGSGAFGFRVEANNGDAIFRTNNFSYNVLMCENAGSVGIGTSSPSALLHIAATGNDPVLISNSGASSYNSLILSNNNNFKIAIGIGGGSVGGNLQDNGYIGTISNRDLLFNTNNTERMRIRNDGIVMIGTTAYNSAIKGILFNPDGYAFYTADGANVMYLNRLTSDGNIIQFQKNTSVVGSISTNTYSLPSDLNFKKNINTLELGLNLVTKLRAVSYNHKIDDEGAALSTGFIAQELEQSLNELGVQQNEYYILQHKPNKDETQSQYWLDYTKMIPVLVNAIKEQQAQIEELKALIEAK